MPLESEFSKSVKKLPCFNLAEREGFEPTVLFRYSRFPGVRLKPLSHLSGRGLNLADVWPWCNVFPCLANGQIAVRRTAVIA